MSRQILYYQTERGQSPIEDFLNAISWKARAKCISYIDILEEHGPRLPRSFIAKVRGNLWELRPEWGGSEYRLLYFTPVGQQVVILHAISKKSQRLKSRDIEVAEARMRDVRRRLRHEKTPPVRQRAD